MAIEWKSGTISNEFKVIKDHINEVIDTLNYINKGCQCNCNYACTCNCNYSCTCNCNYCTCTCNYACTCNCNYSDKRLKKEILYLGY